MCLKFLNVLPDSTSPVETVMETLLRLGFVGPYNRWSGCTCDMPEKPETSRNVRSFHVGLCLSLAYCIPSILLPAGIHFRYRGKLLTM